MKTYSGKTWIFYKFRKLDLKYSLRMLNFFSIGLPFIDC